MRIYLDNAATSWPEPDAVYEAVDRYQREIGAAAGRGSYQSAQQSQQLVSETRASCARMLGIANPNQVLFTSNGSASLNLAIHGLLHPGDHVVTTVCEHNSVLRPLHWQQENNGVQVTHVGCDEAGYISPSEIASAIGQRTKLIAITHASNVTGALQPIQEIAQLTHNAGAFLLVDAAQTAGCVSIDVESLDIDMLACGGHKGLLGPLGIGLLYLRPGIEQRINPLMQGGTGVNSFSSTQPDQMPEKFEAGNLNLPAIAGLRAAVEFLRQQTIVSIQQNHLKLTDYLLNKLSHVDSLKIFGPAADQPRVGVVSCAIEGYDPQELATALDLIAGVECRAGLHCAPRMHSALGTDQAGGLVRFSPGWATTTDDIDAAVSAVITAAENIPN